MTAIKEAMLPKNDEGNDPNDQKADPDFLSKIKPITALTELTLLSATNRLT